MVVAQMFRGRAAAVMLHWQARAASELAIILRSVGRMRGRQQADALLFWFETAADMRRRAQRMRRAAGRQAGHLHRKRKKALGAALRRWADNTEDLLLEQAEEAVAETAAKRRAPAPATSVASPSRGFGARPGKSKQKAS